MFNFITKRFFQASVGLTLAKVGLLAFLILAYIVFGLSLDNHFVSDDWTFLYQAILHPHVVNIWQFAFDLNTSWFIRPIQWLITWTLYSFFELRPWGFHLASIALHSLNTLLFAAFFYSLLLKRSWKPKHALLYSLLAGVLFFVNWHHHEAIFWYAAINEPLNGFFQLTSLLALLLAIVKKQHQILYLGVALGAFLLGLLTKESASVLPIIAGLLISLNAIIDLRQRKKFHAQKLFKDYLKLLPFIILLSAWLGIYFYQSNDYLQGVATGGSRNWLVVAIGLTRYFFGHYINARYLLPWSHGFTLWMAGVVLLIMIVALLRKRYVWGWAFSWMIIGCIPYLLFTPFPSDRFLYVTSVPASILIVETLLWIKAELDRSKVQFFQIGIMGLLYSLTGFYLVAHLSTLYVMETEWDTAGDIGHEIISQVQTVATTVESQTTLCLDNLPDNYERKYVFRNGLVQALYIAYGHNDFKIRSVVQPMSESHPRQTLQVEGCDYVFSYDDNKNTLLVKSEPADR